MISLLQIPRARVTIAIIANFTNFENIFEVSKNSINSYNPFYFRNPNPGQTKTPVYFKERI